MIENNRVDRELVRENRRLRNALEELLTELESGGPVDCECVREELGRGAGGIEPPWVREGFETKDEWLESKRGGGE